MFFPQVYFFEVRGRGFSLPQWQEILDKAEDLSEIVSFSLEANDRFLEFSSSDEKLTIWRKGDPGVPKPVRVMTPAFDSLVQTVLVMVKDVAPNVFVMSADNGQEIFKMIGARNTMNLRQETIRLARTTRNRELREHLRRILAKEKQSRFPAGKSVDVGKWLRDHGHEDAAKQWDEYEGDIEEIAKKASRKAMIRAAYFKPHLRRDLFRILLAEDAKGKMWEKYLKEKWDGGKARVPNPNQETKDTHKDVAFSTAFKNDSFKAKVFKDYHEWVKKQKDGKGSKAKVGDKIEDLSQLSVGDFIDGGDFVGKVTAVNKDGSVEISDYTSFHKGGDLEDIDEGDTWTLDSIDGPTKKVKELPSPKQSFEQKLKDLVKEVGVGGERRKKRVTRILNEVKPSKRKMFLKDMGTGKGRDVFDAIVHSDMDLRSMKNMDKYL